MAKATKKEFKLKRFLVFGGDCYYPCGGWNDFKGSFGTKKAAIKLASSFGRDDWVHVFDTATGIVVYGN